MEWGAESGDLALFCVVGVVGWGFGWRLFASLGGYLRVSEFICEFLGYICDFVGFICEFSIIFATWGGGGARLSVRLAGRELMQSGY